MTSWWAALCGKQKPVPVTIPKPKALHFLPGTLIESKDEVLIIIAPSIRSEHCIVYECRNMLNNISSICDFDVKKILQTPQT